jgi:uncharacterized protein
LAKTGRSLVAGALILTLLMCGSDRAEGYQPVQSVLEIRHDRVLIQKWDLSCGAAALGTLLRYQFGEPVSEEEITIALMGRAEYVAHPELLQAREGFSFLDLKRYLQTYRTAGLYKGLSWSVPIGRSYSTSCNRNRATLYCSGNAQPRSPAAF